MTTLIRCVASILSAVAGTALLALMLLIAIDVVGRYFVNAPLTFAVELVEILVGAMIMLSLASATANGSHVRVDLLLQTLPVSARQVLEACSNLLMTLFFALATWMLSDKVWSLYKDGVYTPILELRTYPAGVVLILGSVAGTAAAAISLVSGVRAAKHQDPELD